MASMKQLGFELKRDDDAGRNEVVRRKAIKLLGSEHSSHGLGLKSEGLALSPEWMMWGRWINLFASSFPLLYVRTITSSSIRLRIK